MARVQKVLTIAKIRTTIMHVISIPGTTLMITCYFNFQLECRCTATSLSRCYYIYV